MVNEEGIPDSGRDSSLEETHKLPPASKEGLLRAGAGESTRALRRWAPPLAEEVQRALPQYEVTGFIARGGMGAVYKGVQKALNRAVAIKILPAEIVDDDLDFVGRFKREAQAMAALSHPNIVTVYEAGETPQGLLYFTMEYVDGTDVGELVAERGRLPQEEALRITSAVLAAMDCAHARSIIHRDIKPSNVLINKQGEVKVADFGLAKVAAADGGLTQSVVTVGTPDFLAPETYVAGFPLDQRADIYSAGVMLYKMLTGRVPRGRFDAPSGEVRGMDPRLDRIIDKAMQEDREKRYATAKEMRLEVEEALSKPMSREHEAGLPASKSSGAPVARGKRGLWIVAAGLAAVAVGFVVWSSQRAGTSQMDGAGALPAVAKADSSETEPWVDMLQPGAAGELHLDGIEKPGPEGLQVTANGKASIAGTDKPGRGDGAIRISTRFEVVTRSRLSVRARHNKNGLTYALMALTPDKIALQIWSGEGSTRTLKDFALASPLVPGQEYQLELRAVGSTLTVRLDGKSLGQVEDTTIPQGAFMIGLGTGPPVTVRALDYLDLSASRSSGASFVTSATGWHDAFAESPLKEVIAKHGGTSQGFRLPANHHWKISRRSHGAGALRVRATSAGEKFVSLYIELDDRTLKRLRFRPGDNKWMLSRGSIGPDEVDFAARSGLSPFDGQPHELLFARFGGRLVTMLDGQLLHDEADDSATPGGFVLDIYPDAEIVADKVEYLNLDGVPEDEALRLLGIKKN